MDRVWVQNALFHKIYRWSKQAVWYGQYRLHSCTLALSISDFIFPFSKVSLQHQDLAFIIIFIVITIGIIRVVSKAWAKCSFAAWTTFNKISWLDPVLMEAAVAWCCLWRLARLDTHAGVALGSAMATLVGGGVVGEVVEAVHVLVRHASGVNNLLKVHHLVAWLQPLVCLAE